MRKLLSIFIILIFAASLKGQENTIGVLELDEENVQDGYTLFYPENQNRVFLINNCGEIIHEWIGEETQGPGKDVHIWPDGSLLKASTQAGVYSNSFGTGGAGGIVEILSWDSDVLYSRIIADSLERQHHDVHPMPNGNILAIVWERRSLEEAYARGFNPSNPQIELWPDMIVEIDPSTDNIVWQWKTWDHMIQEYDSTKSHYGIVKDNPGLIDINYIEFAFGRQDIHHINGIDYNEELDQIVLSCRNFNEVWVIDHSTTIEEAAGHTGGMSGKGGDLLYRWGNSRTYNSEKAEAQKLFRPHDAQWQSVDGNIGISVFNNFVAQDLSLGQLVIPEYENGMYSFDQVYPPTDFDLAITHPDTAKGFSTAGSSFEFLPDGNFLLCAARQGRIFEVTSDGDLVWEYLVPIRNGFPISQGQEISLSENFTFTAKKYPFDFEAFENRDLSPKGYLELEPNLKFCMSTSSLNSLYHEGVTIFPNPASESITIQSDQVGDYKIMSSLTRMSDFTIGPYTKEITLDISTWNPGLYFIIPPRGKARPFVKW